MARKALIVKSQKEPKYKTRRYNRCQLCGRPRAYYRKFQICRICFRSLASKGEIPGIKRQVGKIL